MSEAEEKATGVIGRGESIITKKHPDADVEAENSAELARERILRSKASRNPRDGCSPRSNSALG